MPALLRSLWRAPLVALVLSVLLAACSVCGVNHWRRTESGLIEPGPGDRVEALLGWLLAGVRRSGPDGRCWMWEAEAALGTGCLSL